MGRTEAKCRVFDKKDTVCQNKIKAGEPIDARLITNDAICFSACVGAFAGGSSRDVARGAFIGVHSSRRLTQQELQRVENKTGVKLTKLSDARIRQNARHYHLEMGIDPDLVDFWGKTPHEKMYVLDPGELVRFGLVTRSDNYESPWTSYESSTDKFIIAKSFTRRSPLDPAENLTTLLYLLCSSTGKPLISYRRELMGDSDQATTFMGAAFDDWFLEFKSIGTRSAVEIGGFVDWPLYEEAVAKFAAAKTLIIWEQMKGSKQEILKTKFSNAGLQAALNEFRKRCVPAVLSKDVPGSMSQPVKIVPVKPASPAVTSVKVKPVETILDPKTIAPDSKQFSTPQASTVE